MTTIPVSRFRQAWYKWKSLRLPWRRKLFVGMLTHRKPSSRSNPPPATDQPQADKHAHPGYDLQGNTYWTFHIAGARNWRRIVHPRSTHQYSDVKVPPQWHSWLRYTSPAPPTLEQQTAEAARQERIRLLAAQADARWEAKERIAGDVAAREQLPTGEPRVPSVEGGNAGPDVSEAGARKEKEDPWAKARGGGEGWQPEAWTPTAKK